MSSSQRRATPQPSAFTWEGRTDGDGAEHRRWHQAVTLGAGLGVGEDSALGETAEAPAATLLGFASDAGVARNMGRVGAAQGPDALRKALSSLAYPARLGAVVDAGDLRVSGDELEDGQADLGAAIAEHLGAGRFVTVLGGGHETAFGSYLGLAQSGLLDGAPRLGILNLDAHFDLRLAERPSSGTPFLQMAQAQEEAGREFHYAVVGISEPNNTQTLFDTAHRLGVRYLKDEECQGAEKSAVVAFVEAFLADVDVAYLTIDLDVLPAAVAPGVSAPAGYGVPFDVIRAAAVTAARSGKLALLDVVELNPAFDVDGRTARSAARLIHDVVTRRLPRGTNAAQ